MSQLLPSQQRGLLLLQFRQFVRFLGRLVVHAEMVDAPLSVESLEIQLITLMVETLLVGDLQ